MADHQILLDFVKKGLCGEEGIDEIAQRLKAAAQVLGQKLNKPTALKLAQQLVPSDVPPPPPPPEVALPKLIVDWGVYPQVGNRSRPHFLLLCPETYQQERPRVHVDVDKELEHDFPVTNQRRLRKEGTGLWGFYVPFSLTFNGKDCRPGQYLISVKVEFADMADPQLPHVFHCTIRLRIPTPDANRERTLEIDGDGKSIINLQGQDLRRFGRVVLRGADKGIINLHNSELLKMPETDEEPGTEQESVTHTFDLKPDIEFQGPPSHIPEDFKNVRPSKLEMAMFLFENDSRILLIPKKKITIGRNRGIPIVLRFLPRSRENDRHSLNISRNHLTLELNKDGLLVKDRGPDRHEKPTGALQIADQVVRNGEQHVLGRDQIGANMLLELPYGFNYDQTFEFEIDLFGGDDDDGLQDETRSLDELKRLRRVVGATRKPPLWRLVEQNGMEAVRLRRRSNLETEQYVLLYRKALIGNSLYSSPICIDDGRLSNSAAQLFYLDRSFWLQNLGPTENVQVDRRPIGPGETIPLREGMELLFGETTVRFEKARQMHL